MKQPFVSVVIPIRNAQATLAKCLQSLTAQTYPHFEIIAVNNNSMDTTKEILENCAQKDKRIKIVEESFVSASQARNTGVQYAKGEVIAMLDADCQAHKNWLQEITHNIVHNNETICMGKTLTKQHNYWAQQIQKSEEEFREKMQNGPYIEFLDSKNLAAKRSLLQKIPFDKDVTYVEDFDYYLRIKKTTKISYQPSAIVNHIHKTSFFSVVKLYFLRGKAIGQLSKKYQVSHPIFESTTLRNNILFPLWLVSCAIKNSLKRFCFILISESAWRIGIIVSIV